MLPLLAQASSSITDSDGAKILFALIVIGLIAYGLSVLRDLRKNITSEVRMQLREDEAEGESQKIPQPLTVRAHIDFTPLRDHQQLKAQFDKLSDQRREDVHGLHVKIEQGLQKTRDDLASARGEIGKLQVSQETQTKELHAIRVEQSSVGARIDSMPQRIVQTLKDTKGLL